MKKATLKDIKEGVFLYMQNESDLSFLFYPWGNIEPKDIPRLKREIRGGTCLWWIKEKTTRTTAARLDRFKKPDGWAQRRVEDGFAVSAECMAEEYRAIKAARWDVLVKKCNDIERQIYEGAIDLLANAHVKIPHDTSNDTDSFANTITGGTGNSLDKIGRLQCFDRLNWIEKPEIESYKFRYDPTWMEDEQLGNIWHLCWNYEETDAGLWDRIKESTNGEK